MRSFCFVNRFVRVAFTSPKPIPVAKSDDTTFEAIFAPQPLNKHKISELVLHTAARVNRFEGKAGFAVAPDLYEAPTPDAPPSIGLTKYGFVDLTSRMRPDGSLNWVPEAGRWIVFRMGYSLTGARNSPASPEATGLEVDKLNRTYVKWLDLGSVKNLAEVTVNGTPLGIAWKAPFRIDVTDALKPGSNALEIKVTNLWVNRLIGDAQPNVAKKYTYTTQQFYRANSPLAPSGLLGPVRIIKED